MNNKIIATRVLIEKCDIFLINHFGSGFIQAQNGLFRALRNMCDDYHGAYWEVYELSNGGFYSAPNLHEPLNLNVAGNGFRGILSPDAAGIVASLCVMNEWCWLTKSEKMIDQYYLLRNFANEHQEADKIYWALD